MTSYQTHRHDAHPASHERINALVNRLSARKRWLWAARIYGHWLEQSSREPEADDPPATSHLWRYGGLLRDAGDNAKAADVFRTLAMRLGQPGAGPSFMHLRGFDEWARCLDALGQHQSAAETRALRRRAAGRLDRERDEDDDRLRTLSPSRLLRPVVSRCAFSMSFEWESTGDSFNIVADGDLLKLRERFRIGEPPGSWLDLEVAAPAEPEPRYPHVAICVTIPWRFAADFEVNAVLALVNEMNAGNAACSTCFDSKSGQIAVRSRIGFAGYNEAAGPLNDLASAQEEATLNMLAEVVSTVVEWVSRIAELSTRFNGDRGSPASHG